MIEFGKTLKEAREARGMTVADIAAKTHMMSAMVSDLENEDFSRLPALIYGRGFIKLYCEVVGLDPAPLIAEFMEISNGNREPAIRERTVSPAGSAETAATAEPAGTTAAAGTPETSGTPEPFDTPDPTALNVKSESLPVEPEPVFAQEPPLKEQLDLFSSPAARVPQKTVPLAPQKSVDSVLPKRSDELEGEPPKREHVFAHYASPLRDRAIELQSFAPAVGRWCVVIGILAAVIWGAAVGLKALYRATNDTKPTVPAPTAQPAAVKPTKPAAAKPPASVKASADAAKKAKPVKTDRKPIAVPPLYID